MEKQRQKTTILVAKIVTLVILALLIPSMAEFLVALHNRYSVYPVGTDTNMYGKEGAAAAFLCLGWSVLLAFWFKFNMAVRVVIVVLCTLAMLTLTSKYIPNFLPDSWCKYELRIWPCEALPQR